MKFLPSNSLIKYIPASILFKLISVILFLFNSNTFFPIELCTKILDIFLYELILTLFSTMVGYMNTRSF